MTDNDHGHDDTLDALLCSAFDGVADDPVRAALMLALRLCRLDAEREEAADKLRREGPPPVFKFF